jgi:hypothetical protein
MDDEAFIMTFPAYSLLLKDGSGAILLQNRAEIWLPIFTDRDSVQTYVERSEIKDCLVVEIPDAVAFKRFLLNPPSRAGKTMPKAIIIDPIDPRPRSVTLFDVQHLLSQLPDQ